MAIGLAAVVEPGDCLLPHIAALGEGDGAFVEPRLLGDHRVVEVDAVARPAALDPHDLGRRLRHRRGAPLDDSAAQLISGTAVAQQIDADVAADHADGNASELGDAMRMLVHWEIRDARHRRGVGADQRQQAALDCALV